MIPRHDGSTSVHPDQRAVTPLRAMNGAAASDSTPGTHYRIHYDTTTHRAVACGCPSFVHRGDCKHLRRANEALSALRLELVTAGGETIVL